MRPTEACCWLLVMAIAVVVCAVVYTDYESMSAVHFDKVQGAHKLIGSGSCKPTHPSYEHVHEACARGEIELQKTWFNVLSESIAKRLFSVLEDNTDHVNAILYLLVTLAFVLSLVLCIVHKSASLFGEGKLLPVSGRMSQYPAHYPGSEHGNIHGDVYGVDAMPVQHSDQSSSGVKSESGWSLWPSARSGPRSRKKRE